jgi:ABC-type molybdate transport system substrate-binding protein
VLARVIACAALALAVAPAAAQAQDELPAVPVPAAEALMSTAHSLAVARWGTDPCGGQVTMSWSHMGTGINARSQWMSIDVHDPSTYSECAIAYNLDVDWDWPKLCTVIEHELGHLSGHDHVNDPHDVMSPYYLFPSAECSPASQQAQAAKPDSAPRSAASSRRASSTKRKAKKRKAAAAVKGKPAKKRNKSKRKKAHSASLSAGSGLAGAASLGARGGFFGCVLVAAR